MNRSQVRSLADPARVRQMAGTLAERGSLAGIAADTLAEFLRLGDLIELEPGEALIREGAAATPEVYLLLEGALAVLSRGKRLARLERVGDVIGEVAAVLASKRTADVVAETPARAVAVPTQALAQPEFADIAAGIRGAMLRDDWVQY